MSTFYTAHIMDPFGLRLDSIANFVASDSSGTAALDYALNVGRAGVLALTVPGWYDDTKFRLDGRVGIERAINGRAPYLDGEAVFLIRTWIFDESANTITIMAYHANCLKSRRIIDYVAGSSYSSKAATAAANLMRTFWLENFGASISAADRQGVETQADISAYVATQPASGLGASVGKAAAWRNFADVDQEIGQASTTAGTYLVSEIVAPTESTLEYRTYTGQRGEDHRAGTAQPVIFSVERGNLENARLIIDHSQEVTMAIAGGMGTGTGRLIATAVDTARMAASPLNRIEQFVDMGNTNDATQLQDEADATLWNGRPQTVIEGTLIETPGCTRDIHYGLGDLATARVMGRQVDVRLDTLHIRVSSEGQRTEARFRGVV